MVNEVQRRDVALHQDHVELAAELQADLVQLAHLLEQKLGMQGYGGGIVAVADQRHDLTNIGFVPEIMQTPFNKV